MSYKIHPGVVLVKVCGAPILVAKREIWQDFSMIRPISKIGEIVWNLLGIGSTWDRVLYICSALTRSTPEEAEPKLKTLCANLVKDGFLLEVPDEEPEHDNI